MSNSNVPENALFVCFGGMSNVGTLTGLAGLQAVRQVEPRARRAFFAWAKPCKPANRCRNTLKHWLNSRLTPKPLTWKSACSPCTKS